MDKLAPFYLLRIAVASQELRGTTSPTGWAGRLGICRLEYHPRSHFFRQKPGGTLRHYKKVGSKLAADACRHGFYYPQRPRQKASLRFLTAFTNLFLSGGLFITEVRLSTPNITKAGILSRSLHDYHRRVLEAWQHGPHTRFNLYAVTFKCFLDVAF